MMEWMISSSALILIFMVMRRLLRGKISQRLQYVLWALVLLRLLVPMQLSQSPISVLRVTQQPQINSVMEAAREPIRVERQYVNGESFGKSILHETAFIAEREDPNHFYTPAELGFTLWKWGCVLVLGFILISNLHFLRKLEKNRQKWETGETALPVYISSRVETPCLAGVFRPAIYLPERPVEPEQLRHVLAHEMTHYRHKDHIISVFRCIALALHWYNPLVWWAAKVSGEDAELACDEGTIARLGEGERIAYGKTLLALSCVNTKSGMISLATTMYTGENGLKKRIQRIARKPKTTLAALCVMVLAVALAVGCTFTGDTEGESAAVPAEEDLILKLEQMEQPEEIEEMLKQLPQWTRQFGLGIYEKTNYGRKGRGHGLSDDQIESLDDLFSQYQWSRETDIAAITESDRWMELSFGVSQDAEWRVRLQCSALDQELVFLYVYDLEDGKITDARENLIFRAVPRDDGTVSLYEEMAALFWRQTEK